MYYAARLIIITQVLFTFFLPVINPQAYASDDTAVVSQLILKLSSPSPQDRSAAAAKLADYPYEETRAALLKALQTEIQAARSNSYVLTAAVDALAPLVDQSNTEQLYEIQAQLNTRKESWVRHVASRLDAAIDNAEQLAPQSLRRLTSKQSAPTDAQMESSRPPKTFVERVQEAMVEQKIDPRVAGTLFDGTEKTISDEMARLAADPSNPRVIGRTEEAIQTLDVLVRFKSRIPVLIGRAGVGKTAVAQAIALMLHEQTLPDWHVYQQELPKGTVVLQTSPARIGRLAMANTDGAQAAALESYFTAIQTVERALGTAIVIFIDELHTFSKAQLNAFKPFAESLEGIRMIGATTHGEYLQMVGFDKAIKRRTTLINIAELTLDQTIEVLKQGWIPQIENRYRISIPEKLLPTLVQVAKEVSPDLALPDAPIKFIQDLAIRQSRTARPTENDRIELTERMAREFAGEITGIPINPADPKALVRYVEEGREYIRSRVIGQDHLVDLLVNAWQDVLTSNAERAAKSVAVIGTTGTGKSLTAEVLGQKFLGSKEKVLVIDATAYQTGGLSLNTLIGAPNGVISSDQTKGILPEWLSGPGAQSGVIIFNEFDKAHPDLAKRIMEMLDRKELTGGDGQVYRLRRHLIVFTTNRGANRIFSRETGNVLSDEQIERRIRSITESQARSFFIQSEGYAHQDENKLPPEVVGRIDRWGVAKPLTFNDAMSIAQLKVNSVIRENAEIHGLNLEVAPELIEAVVRSAFVAADGARPVEQRIENILSRARTQVWSTLDTVQNASVRVDATKIEEGTYRVEVVEKASSKRLGEFVLEYPTRFMALNDPRFLETLRTLDQSMNTEIFGQEHAISEMAAAVRERAMRPFDHTPLSVWLLGSTGTGKTETAKVLAKKLYGSSERARVLSFGKVNHPFDLGNIFNPPKGVVGSGEPGLFERILMDFPEGAVIVFDELSNMGGAVSAQEKEALFKTLYEIFEEGRWTSSLGKTYDLASYTFILTGNDGEKLFERLPNEDLRDTTWEDHKSREQVKKLLRESRVPEAFINRIQSIVLMRPMRDSVRAVIADKFVREITNQVREAHGVELVFAKGFTDRVAEAFFPVSDGARGARRFILKDMSAVIGDLILERYAEFKAGRETSRVEVDLELNFPERTWSVDEALEPQATLKLTATIGKGKKAQRFTMERQFEPTSAPRLISHEEAVNTSIHEAGHALVNEHLGRPTGPLEHLTIKSAGNFGGYARYDSKKANKYPNIQTLTKRMATMAGGMAAQQEFGLPRDAGWGSDLNQMRTMSMKAVAELGLIEGLEFLPLSKTGEVDTSKLDGKTRERLNREAQRLIEESIALAKHVLSQPEVRKQVERIRDALLERGSLSGAEYLDVIGKYRVDSAALEKFINEKHCSGLLTQ